MHHDCSAEKRNLSYSLGIPVTSTAGATYDKHWHVPKPQHRGSIGSWSSQYYRKWPSACGEQRRSISCCIGLAKWGQRRKRPSDETGAYQCPTGSSQCISPSGVPESIASFYCGCKPGSIALRWCDDASRSQ